ncbi:MAG: hypothetical protein Q4B60_09705 [Erysipelotrichaceae bacterium]|nr:hypothetical protein [Erysipelotrichaceae bacterium]
MMEINETIQLFEYLKEKDDESFDKFEMIERRLMNTLDRIENQMIEIEANIEYINDKLFTKEILEEENIEKIPLF